MIEAKDVSCTFARNPFSKEGFMAVSPVSIQFIDGERYAIVGESGSGKTTLARMIAGLQRPIVLENIRAGRPSATREEVLKAAHLAQCDDILKKLPNGIDTIIGSQGIYLSGGETQRISIARAILKDAPIVVLDEATAYADPENEHQIQKAFDGLIKNKTVIMVAHRLSTVQDADQILVMKNGAIAESGTHSDLIKHQGEYAKMWDNYNKTVQWHIES